MGNKMLMAVIKILSHTATKICLAAFMGLQLAVESLHCKDDSHKFASR